MMKKVFLSVFVLISGFLLASGQLPGNTYIYNFADGSVLPQISYSTLRYTSLVSEDGLLTMNSNTSDESMQFGYHDSSHGGVFFPGNSMDFTVAGDATITFGTCQYGNADDAVFVFTDDQGTILDSIEATNIGVNAAGTSSFTYSGSAGVLTATLKSAAHPTAEIYIHGVTAANAPETKPSNGKIDVWDFGAEQLDTAEYNNKLTVDIINAWYEESITPGSSGNVLPSFSAGKLSWVGGGNDRLRTTNADITRYDENIASVTGYTGRIYVNSAANTSRYLSLSLGEDDEITLVTKTDAGGRLNFQYVDDPSAQSDVVDMTSDLVTLHFVAQQEGTYHIFDDQGKPSYYRIYRKDANYVTLTGNLDVSQTSGIPSDYAVVFTNEAGKSWTATMNSASYSVKLPARYTYELSLSNANGFIISNGKSLEVTQSTTTHDVTIVKVELYTVTGNITGLGSDISALGLDFTPDPEAGKIFAPEPVIDTNTATYSVELEPNTNYTVTAIGVNDYYLPLDSIKIAQANASSDLIFETKPLHDVTITTKGLTATQEADLGLTFTNLYEEGYSYSFASISGISLRDGTYTINYSGLDAYPVEPGLTSNLLVDGASASKNLVFKPVTSWSFDDRVIENGDTIYKGLIFSGPVSNEVNKGHLAAKDGATIKVPVNPGDKLQVTYYYSADFTIEGEGPYTTSSGSTSTLEYADYTYNGTEAGYATITIGSGASTTYITEIAIGATVVFKPVITVGTDKDYQTINDALAAIRKMPRDNNERVTVMIDPGNYEEMLVIDMPNVSLKNAAANPSTDILNKGVDIAPEAVRITSYYGHGYNYYSMGSDQKWNTDILRVNKENGYLSYENVGSGTTNGSYWNATVVVSADGFEADHIIFENSFNQYISKKESEDIVVMWDSGSKGERPADYANTSVQDKSFVERAAAIAITNGTDKVVLNKCRVIGRQDSFFGGSDTRVVVYKGAMMGGTDYLFGGMTAVFYKTDLVMNTGDNSSDVSYLTAAQQDGGRGYLMYECFVTSPEPGVETASAYLSKPGYFGRPWQASTSEVVFYNTTIDTSNYPDNEGQSLIQPVGWLSTLGGESPYMYEFGTTELSGEDNSSYRSAWATLLSDAVLKDGTEITTFNFTKGNDDWNPIPDLIAADTDNPDGIIEQDAVSGVKVYSYANKVYMKNVMPNTVVQIYCIGGSLIKTTNISTDAEFTLKRGFWIIRVIASDGQKAVKVMIP